MDYLVTLSPQGVTVFYETYNIKDIQLFQPVNIQGKDEQYYIVIIEYDDGSKEQTVISHTQWDMWNNRNMKEDGNNE